MFTFQLDIVECWKSTPLTSERILTGYDVMRIEQTPNSIKQAKPLFIHQQNIERLKAAAPPETSLKTLICIEALNQGGPIAGAIQFLIDEEELQSGNEIKTTLGIVSVEGLVHLQKSIHAEEERMKLDKKTPAVISKKQRQGPRL